MKNELGILYIIIFIIKSAIYIYIYIQILSMTDKPVIEKTD